MNNLILEGRVYYTKNGYPVGKRYFDESRGVKMQDVWADILIVPPIRNVSATQPRSRRPSWSAS